MARRRVMSGMRPTGRLHIGHLVGVLRGWVALTADNDAFFEVADLHALTTAYDRSDTIGASIHEMVIDWLAAGVDPERATLYVQSHIPQIAEMHLLLSMIVPLAWLQRVPTFKDQIAALGGEVATYGFLGYPLMQLVDIAAMRGEFVPVGRDQLAHLEVAREIVRRVNHLYGAGTLVEPQPILGEFPGVPGTDGRKMSKSYGNDIQIADDAQVTTKKIRSMVTDPLKVRRNDPGRPEVCPVFELHHLTNAARVPSIEEQCRTGALGCVDCKTDLAQSFDLAFGPIRARRAEIDPASVAGVLADGAERARAIASGELRALKTRMSL